MLGQNYSLATLTMAADGLIYASCNRVMTRRNPEAHPVISSARFDAIREVVCESKQRSTKPKTPFQRTRQTIEDVIARHANLGDWLDENNFDIEFVDAYPIEGKIGTCVVLKAREESEANVS